MSYKNPVDSLFSKTRQAVLSFLYGRPDRAFYTKQVLDALNIGRGTVQRELKNLTGAGIILREARGKEVYYRANKECPIFDELSHIVQKAQAMPSLVQEKKAAYTAAGTEAGTAELSILEGEIEAFCRRHHIRRLSLFGSVLREDFRPDSDVDILVEFEPGHVPGLFKLSDMEAELSAMFGGRKVDLRTPAELSRYFRERVVREAKELYAAP